MKPAKILNAAVVVSALGYFVDVFDMLLFGVVRVKSLTALGLTGQALTDAGINLQNWQMTGLLIGGIASGIVGDKFGRVRALYFSIALYSVANLLNGFVTNLDMYALCRLLAGIGLAGEVGSGVTLVVESLPTHRRGLGTTLMATFGMLGAVAAGCIEWFVSDWRTIFFIGGSLGLVLLALRLSVAESEVFKKLLAKDHVARGNFLSLFTQRQRLLRLVQSTFLGVTTWFIVGILMLLAPEFGAAKGIPDAIKPGMAIIWFHLGMSAGDLCSGLLSQMLQSRLRAFLALQALAAAIYLFAPLSSATQLYAVLVLLGFSAGFWVVFITNASEQFGTNIRATAACTIPSFVRGLFIPIAMSFKWLKSPDVLGSPIAAATMVGGVCLTLAFLSSYMLRDTFHQELDFEEV